MASTSDQAVGYGLVLLSGLLFAYYTLWVVILPFVDEEHILHSFFLPQIYAFIIPVTAGVIVLIGLGVFIGCVVQCSKKKQEKKTN